MSTDDSDGNRNNLRMLFQVDHTSDPPDDTNPAEALRLIRVFSRIRSAADRQSVIVLAEQLLRRSG